MLKGIPKIISPDLLKYLSEMGHSDRLVIADGNFPAATFAKNSKLIRMDGHNVPEMLDAILTLFPLDTYVDSPVTLMEKVKGDNLETPIWDEFEKIVTRHDDRGKKAVSHMERFEFYEAAKSAYLIIATTEAALYANVMLQKGVIK